MSTQSQRRSYTALLRRLWLSPTLLRTYGKRFCASEGVSAGNGLTCLEMAGILEQAGARCFGANYGTLPPAGAVSPPFQKYLYGSVESGVSFRQACLT